MTRRFTDDQWRELKGLSQIYGKNSKQFQLIEFLRYQPVYDPDLERDAFAHCNLTSMRSTAKYWLIRAAWKLGFYASELDQYCLDIDVVLEWQDWDEALFMIGEAKIEATAQEDFNTLAILLQQEKTATRSELRGDERDNAMQKIDEEIIANAKILLLQAEIGAATTTYFERTQLHFRDSGEVNLAIPTTYFQSAFYQTDISHWPLSFQIAKLRIDELNHFFLQQFEQSIEVVERRLDLMEKSLSLRAKLSTEHSKALFRVATYYMEINDWEKVDACIEKFRSLNPFAPENKANYLRRFLFVLYRAAFMRRNSKLAMEATAIWVGNREYLMTLRRDSTGVVLMLLACSASLANYEISMARTAFSFVFESIESLPNLAFQALIRIFHLILLLEDRDDIGLESYGRNYRRYMRKVYPNGSTSRSLVVLLANPANLTNKSSMQKMIVSFKTVLHECQQARETEMWSFIYPLMKWAENRVDR